MLFDQNFKEIKEHDDQQPKVKSPADSSTKEKLVTFNSKDSKTENPTCKSTSVCRKINREDISNSKQNNKIIIADSDNLMIAFKQPDPVTFPKIMDSSKVTSNYFKLKNNKQMLSTYLHNERTNSVDVFNFSIAKDASWGSSSGMQANQDFDIITLPRKKLIERAENYINDGFPSKAYKTDKFDYTVIHNIHSKSFAHN